MSNKNVSFSYISHGAASSLFSARHRFDKSKPCVCFQAVVLLEHESLLGLIFLWLEKKRGRSVSQNLLSKNIFLMQLQQGMKNRTRTRGPVQFEQQAHEGSVFSFSIQLY